MAPPETEKINISEPDENDQVNHDTQILIKKSNIQVALHELGLTIFTGKESDMSSMGLFISEHGKVSLRQRQIRFTIPYTFEKYLLPLKAVKKLLKDTLDNVSRQTSEARKSLLGSPLLNESKQSQTEICKGLPTNYTSEKKSQDCLTWAHIQFSNYLEQQNLALFRAADSYSDVLIQNVYALQQTYAGPIRPRRSEQEKKPASEYEVTQLAYWERDQFGMATMFEIASVELAMSTVIDSQEHMLVSIENTAAVLTQTTERIYSVTRAMDQLEGMVQTMAEKLLREVGSTALINRIISRNLYAQSASNIFIRTSFILQRIEARFNIVKRALRDAYENKFTHNVLAPEELKKVLRKFKEIVFQPSDQYLDDIEDEAHFINFYTNAKIELHHSKLGLPLTSIYIPLTSEKEMYKHIRIISMPYRSHGFNNNTYRMNLGLQTNKVDLLVKGDNFIIADIKKFQEHNPMKINIYTSKQLISLNASQSACVKAIVKEDTVEILSTCTTQPIQANLEILKLASDETLIYSPEERSVTITCPQRTGSKPAMKTFEISDLAQIRAPDTCNIQIGAYTYVGIPDTIAHSQLKPTEFSIKVQHFEEFETYMWIYVIRNQTTTDRKLLENLLQDIGNLNYTISDKNKNKTQELMKNIETSLKKAEVSTFLSRQLMKLVGNPYIVSITTLTIIILIIIICLGCICSKLQGRNTYSRLRKYELHEVETAMTSGDSFAGIMLKN